MFSWLSIISGAFSAIGRALGLIHDANERTAGANQVIAKDNAINAEAEHDASQAVVDTTRASALEQLREGRG